MEVWETEEKGSDVNLAAYLLKDAFDGDYEQALVVSNDSDLVLPIKMVRDELHLPVGVVNPNTDPRAPMPANLRQAATFTRQLHKGALRASLFPESLKDAKGVIRKPAGW